MARSLSITASQKNCNLAQSAVQNYYAEIEMRELGFSEKWPKLKQGAFTTFRFQRRDKDWQVGEVVRVVYKPRSKEREVLGVAEIVSKEKRNMVKALADDYSYATVSEDEARADGFNNYWELWHWLFDAHHGGQRFIDEPMNKLTLRWQK